jgi:urease accessory protein
MDLAFAAQNGRTVLREAYCEVPFKITRVLNPEASPAHLILMQCSAGLFGGDDWQSSIRIGRGARIRVTQQSATRIHPSQDRVAVQRHSIFVEAGAQLQLYLEPVIPFAESRLRQSTELHVEPGGRFCFWEGFMTGRVGRGESWRFRELASETRLCADGRLAYLDRFHLRPGNTAPSRWAMDHHTYLGTGLYVGEHARDFAATLHRELPEAGVAALSDHVAAARVVSPAGPAFHAARETFCRCSDGL